MRMMELSSRMLVPIPITMEIQGCWYINSFSPENVKMSGSLLRTSVSLTSQVRVDVEGYIRNLEIFGQNL